MARRLAAQLHSALPTFRISPEGEYLGVVDWEAHVERSIAGLSGVGEGPDPSALEQTRRMMLDPTNRQMLETKTGEMWQVWVQAWIGVNLAPGEVREEVTTCRSGRRRSRPSWSSSTRARPRAGRSG